MAEEFDPTISGQSLGGKFRSYSGKVTCTELSPEDGSGLTVRSCTFVANFGFRYIRALKDGSQPPDELEDENLAVEIEAAIAVDYLIGTPEMPNKEELNRWGSSNVLLHAWPYWREYCHNTLARMNVPVTLMPLLTLEPKAIQAQKKNVVAGSTAKPRKVKGK